MPQSPYASLPAFDRAKDRVKRFAGQGRCTCAEMLEHGSFGISARLALEGDRPGAFCPWSRGRGKGIAHACSDAAACSEADTFCST